MNLLVLIIIFSLIGGIVSLAGGVIILQKKHWSRETLLSLVSFAAGVLLSTAFAELLPEALELIEDTALHPENLFYWTLAAIAGLFLFEHSFFWFHHHHGTHNNHPDPVIPLVWFGDTLHNFIDGLVITASFFVSIPLGITTAFAVAAHEIPQEIADFSLFLSKGVARRRVLFLNIISGLATVIGALLAFFFWNEIAPWQPHLLAFTAGMFIYIAGSDLILELHLHYREHTKKGIHLHTLMFFVGLFGTLIISSLLHAE